MAMKEWLHWLPPPRSLLALLIAIAGFSGRLFAAHLTHSPTLLVDTCHSLCRLVGLITTVLAYKYERADEGAGREGRLRNTFGWARIEVVGRLSVHVLFASFALALVVNALQLGVHSSHGQPPRYPRVIVGSAVIGLLFHAINYMLLAGRELSYSRRLSVTEGGAVVLKTGSAAPVLAHAPTDIASSIPLNLHPSKNSAEYNGHYTMIAALVDDKYLPLIKLGLGLVDCWWHLADNISVIKPLAQNLFHVEFFRAINDTFLFVMGAGLTLEWEPVAARLADPALSASAAIILVIFNYPFMRSAGLVLLQTVPEGLGACDLRAAALRVPGVLAIHELHVWQLHRDRLVATAHVCYGSYEAYLQSSGLVCDIFKRHGIGLVTLQPEFSLSTVTGTEEEKKLLVDFANVACSCPCAKECIAPRCCQTPREPSITRI